MAKKKPKKRVKKKRVKKYAGKTEREWRDWGESFGKRMEKLGKELGYEADDFAKRFEKRIEKRHKNWERRIKEKCISPFGFLGPLFSSLFGILLVLILIWFLTWVNSSVGSLFVFNLKNYINVYMSWIFIIFLFLNYTDYFSKNYWRHFWMVKPITTSIKIVIFVLFIVFILNSAEMLPSFSKYLFSNLLNIFLLFMVIGYIFVLIKKNFLFSRKKWKV